MNRHWLPFIFLLLIALMVLSACKSPSKTEFTIDRTACNGCGRCLQVCPNDAIEFDNNGKAIIDQTLCKQDGLCVRVCPQNAVY